MRVNETIEKMIHYTQQEMLGIHISQLNPYYGKKKYRKSRKSMVDKLFNDGKVVEVDSTWKSKDGTLIPIELNSALLKDKKGNIIGGVVGVRDVSERKRLEELKSDFIANISHELRTPLTSIKGSIDNLLDGIVGTINDAQREYLTIINSESNRLVRLIDDLLDLNNLEAQRIVLVPEAVEYISLVAQVVFTLQELAHEKELSLEMEWPRTEIHLHLDCDRVKQILVNLISNAIKFTEQGGIKVTIEDSNNHYVTTRIKDTGVGIPPNELDKVFNKFYQISKPYSAKCDGSGLGLAISKSLIEMHGGTIRVKSEEGKGSEFYFTFPYMSR